ncbi:hypothetical protein AKO1_012613 [Acrasis kona]|uniref:ParB-like nuclease n=1 Tax=Acrasis kona TaxID=1008807 RepID=A0AAW2YW13_9EUKA
MRLYVILSFLLVLLCCSALSKKCDEDVVKGDSCHLRADKARPTQLLFGRLASNCKQEVFEEMKHKDDIDDFLEENPVPAVVGPDGEFFITDHHHLLRSYLDADLKIDKKDRVVRINVIENWKHLNASSFWTSMKQNNYAYLYNQEGVEDLDNLPTKVTKLSNDPYRSLSYIGRVNGAYEKSNVFFAEFIWAKYLKQFPEFAKLSKLAEDKMDSELKFVKSILKRVLEVAHYPQASKLPGYLSEPGKVKLPKCPSIQNLNKKNKSDKLYQFLKNLSK